MKKYTDYGHQGRISYKEYKKKIKDRALEEENYDRYLLKAYLFGYKVHTNDLLRATARIFGGRR